MPGTVLVLPTTSLSSHTPHSKRSITIPFSQVRELRLKGVYWKTQGFDFIDPGRCTATPQLFCFKGHTRCSLHSHQESRSGMDYYPSQVHCPLKDHHPMLGVLFSKMSPCLLVTSTKILPDEKNIPTPS